MSRAAPLHSRGLPLLARRAGPAVALVALACGAADDGASPDPAQRLPGGRGTNTLLLGNNAFTAPLGTLTQAQDLAFFSGNSFFSQAWVPAPASATGRDGLGPLFNARSCGACHALDGRGRPPETPEEAPLGLLFRISVPGAGGLPAPDPVYGDQLQPFSVSDDVPGEVDVSVSTEPVEGAYDDGTPYVLTRPMYTFSAPGYGPLPPDLMVSPRVAPQVYGLGLLMAIPEEALVAAADPTDADGDGVSGRVQRIGGLMGRLGWKADAPSIEAQSAGAFFGDMGLTSKLHLDDDGAGGTLAPEVSDLVLSRVVDYVRFLAVPARAVWDSPEVLAGQGLFAQAQCGACHTPEHRLGPDAADLGLEGERIFPYTDLLLHDLGEDLADGRPLGEASGSEWKTPPLWGIGRIPAVNHHDRLLHDGRARGVAEAILWHGGEAATARDAFKAMSATQRAALVAFVNSL